MEVGTYGTSMRSRHKSDKDLEAMEPSPVKVKKISKKAMEKLWKKMSKNHDLQDHV